MKDWLFYEKEYNKNGYTAICGVDEAGRGPLAGPVCAAAVILKEGEYIEGVNDSKKLTSKAREKLFKVIKDKAISYSVSFSSEKEIDEINILNATHLAMKRAVEGLDMIPDMILVDGNRLPDFSIEAKAIVKGDNLSLSIACASILAKVTRDNLMIDLSKQYPQYGFDRHKGYGTKLHTEKIREFGISAIHRTSFLKGVLNNSGKLNQTKRR